MKTISEKKRRHLESLSNEHGVIAALAIDQRGSIMKMMGKYKSELANEKAIEEFKCLVSEKLTPYASSILLDPEYGLPASKVRHEKAGLILAYEKTGYDANQVGRLPDLLENWSAGRLAREGADAIKILLYYDVDEGEEINDIKHAFVERVGDECRALEIPYFLEIVSYDAKIEDVKSKEYAKIKPHKVIEAMKVFSQEHYHVDVLKVEVPVNMDYVEGYGQDVLHSKHEALAYFKQQSEATQLPFIFLSAGVSAQLFRKTLYFAKEAGSTFNGVLCGRATWKDGVEPYTRGVEEANGWLEEQGRENMEELNAALNDTATSWKERLS